MSQPPSLAPVHTPKPESRQKVSRLNVLLSAYACRPNMGSEPGVGWNMVCEIAKYHNVWVLTRRDNQAFIEAALPPDDSTANLHFVYCDVPGARVWKQGLHTVHIHYYLWQIAAYCTARRLHTALKFDVTHHLTYVRYSTPSFLALLPIPFIWGPVGGGESAPLSFWQDFDRYGKTYERLRSLFRGLGDRDPFVSLTARNSALAYATTEETAIQLRQLGAQTVSLRSQVGISRDDLARFESIPLNTNTPFRFISIGRLLHWKGFHLGLRAFAQANLAGTAEYWIIGDGREREALKALAVELGIASSVKFLGSLSRAEVLDYLAQCHTLVHPSLHESGGFVCLEAMAAGRPVLCLNLGGPAVQVTDKTGVRIVANYPEQVIHELAQAMITVTQNPHLVTAMGDAGRQRATETFSWVAQGQQISQLYTDLANLAVENMV